MVATHWPIAIVKLRVGPIDARRFHGANYLSKRLDLPHEALDVSARIEARGTPAARAGTRSC